MSILNQRPVWVRMNSIKFQFVIFFFLFALNPSFSQNLVPNPSFEEVNKTSKRWSGNAVNFNANIKDWTSPTQGSPDLLNIDFLGEMFPVRPKVDLRPYRPRTGNNMVGIKTYGCQGLSRTLHCKEYVQVKLLNDIVEGGKYYFEYWVMPINTSVKVNSFGLALGDTAMLDATIIREIDTYPVAFEEEVVLGEKKQWHKISGEFEADFNYQYIIAGIFNKDAKMDVVVEKEGLNYGYYLLDDFLVKRIDVPAIEFKVNEVLVLENILFEFDKAILLNSSIEELDQLAGQLKENPSQKIEISGHTDDRGSQEHNLELSKARAIAVQEYLVKKGTDESRIVAYGYGSKFPMLENNSEEHRAKNRRVEIKLVE